MPGGSRLQIPSIDEVVFQASLEIADGLIGAAGGKPETDRKGNQIPVQEKHKFLDVQSQY